MESQERIIDGVVIPLHCVRKHFFNDRDKNPVMYLGNLPVKVSEDLDSRGQLYIDSSTWSMHLCSTIADVVLRKKPYTIPKQRTSQLKDDKIFYCNKCGNRITTNNSRVKAGYWGYCSSCDEDLEYDEVRENKL